MESLQINILSEIHFKIVDIDGVLLKVYKNGEIYKWMKSKQWKLIISHDNRKGYNGITINDKKVSRHRIVCHCFKNLDLNDKQAHVDHIDHDKLNNHMDNLRIVNNQQNHFNRKASKGYCWVGKSKKYRAKISLNYKTINIGYFNTEEEAREAYLRAKEVYHVI